MPIAVRSAGVGQESALNAGQIITNITRIEGVGDTPRSRELCMTALQDAVKKANRMRVWMDRYFEPITDFEAGTKRYPLATRFRLPAGRAWLLDSNDLRRLPVEYKPRRYFMNYIRNEQGGGGGLPFIYTVQNRVQDGMFEVFGIPNASNIINYPKILIPYNDSIPVPGDEDDLLNVGDTLESAIIAEAQMRFMLYNNNWRAMTAHSALAKEAWVEAVSEDQDWRRATTTKGGHLRGL